MTFGGSAEEPRTLLVALDAVPYRVVAEARDRGAFADWVEPSAVVAPFPTVTHVAFASLFEPFGVPPSLGYELRHFDTTANSTVGGGVFEYASDVPPWFELFDLPHRSMVAELANYVSPRAAALRAAGEIEQDVLASDQEVFTAYIGATDGLMHLYGDEHMVELLIELDPILTELRRRHQQVRGRPLRIVLFSDHGCGCTRVRHANGFDSLLRDAGLNVVAQLDGPQDVVAPKFGLVNFGALFLRDEDHADTAASAIARHEAVELAAFSPSPGVVEVVSGSGRGRIRWDGPADALRYSYQDDGSDLLRLTPALGRLDRAGLLDDAGYADGEDWLRETAFEYYPDPLHRLRRALTGDRIRSRASVLYSLGPSWAGGWHAAVVGAWVRHGGLQGTHGGLDRESSLGFFLVNDPMFAMPPAVRADAALARFADLMHDGARLASILTGIPRRSPLSALRSGCGGRACVRAGEEAVGQLLVNRGHEPAETTWMTGLSHERLVSRSAAALFIGAAVVTLANSLASTSLGAEGVSIRAVQMFGVVSLVSGLVVWSIPATRLNLAARVGVATWGLLLLCGSAVVGNYAVTPQASIVIPVFMMVILVWLGLTSARGVAAAYAPVTIIASALLAAVPDSRVGFVDSLMVIVVSTVVAETIAWAMGELRDREELLAALVVTDPLTGLLNRGALAERLEQSCAAHERVMLAFVDLNDFKDVNDTFGHQIGDEVLVELARRLQRVARDGDVVARFGGDEFVILFRGVPIAVDADALVERIRCVVAEPWPMIEPSTMSASIGIVDDRDGSMSPADLLGEADTAMYSRKHGVTSANSPALMTSRALVHHRAAMDGLGGSFTVLRMVGEAESRDWLIIEANARVRQVFGPRCGDPVGQLVSDLDRVADNSAQSGLFAAALDTGARQEAEVVLNLPDEIPQWRRLIVIPVDDRVVAALTWDITSEKAAEQALRDSEERSLAIVESAGDAILTVDEHGLVCSFNRAAESMFAIRREDAIGRSYQPFAAERSLAALREAFTGTSPGEPVDVTLTRATGEEFHAQVAISRVETSVGMVYTAIARDVTEQRNAEEALRTALERDELTGLPNQRSLLERTEKAAAVAREQGDAFGLLFIDLDRFTLVNDSLGHDLGDRLLVQVAERIERSVRTVDTVTRVSGDQFVVLCEHVVSVDALTALASRIQDVLREPFRLGYEREVFATASIGVALSHDSEQPRDLLRFAHTAMHRAKRQGPSGVQLFHDEMSAVTASRLDAETALRHAIERDELCAYYQPIVHLDTGAIRHLEALIRWNRPGVGIVTPDQFIPVAEETSLIVDIGMWMLRRAVTDCAAWQSHAPGVGVAINVSVHQFRGGDLIAGVREILDATGLSPELVMLEITESVMLDHSDWNLAVLERIRDLGVRLALDDFGTGYSALTHLRRLPVDTIKIDRSFLQTIETEDDLPMIRAIIELARAHQVDVIAEGIETEATRRLVRSAGCTSGQGFLFARPAPLEEMRLLLAIETAVQPGGATSHD